MAGGTARCQLMFVTCGRALHTRARMNQPRSWARVAGAAYLVTIVMGIFAEIVVRGSLVVREDAAATARNILANESLYRAGLAADMVMLAAYVVVTLFLYALLKPVNRNVALLAAFFSIVGISVLAVNAIHHLAPLQYLGGAAYLEAFEPAQLQALALGALRMHSRGYLISGVFFGVYCVLIGWLAFRSAFIARFAGVLMAIGGVAYLVNSLTTFLSPAWAARLPDVTIVGGLAELSLTLWLLVKGVKDDAARPQH
jgi:Domain of unknown function (DUF4386)